MQSSKALSLVILISLSFGCLQSLCKAEKKIPAADYDFYAVAMSSIADVTVEASKLPEIPQRVKVLIEAATIENLLIRVARQGDISLRIHDVCLALLQQVLAEAHVTHKISWEFGAARLREEGIGANELEQRFIHDFARAKDYAYGEAERIKDSQRPPR